MNGIYPYIATATTLEISGRIIIENCLLVRDDLNYALKIILPNCFNLSVSLREVSILR